MVLNCGHGHIKVLTIMDIKDYVMWTTIIVVWMIHNFAQQTLKFN